MKSNRGYTLIELIIVIAIMMILSGMSFVSLSIIKSARCNAATSTLNNEMGALLVKTKALSQARIPDPDPITGLMPSDAEDYPLCMVIVKYNSTTEANGLHLRKGSYALVLGYLKSDNSFVAKDYGTVEATIPDTVTIEYDNTQTCAATLDTSQDIFADCTLVSVIAYKKATGEVKYGAGNYSIKKGDTTYSTIYLDKNTGNHYSK